MREVHDPYRAPETDTAIETTGTEGRALPSASRGRRFLTFLLDYLGQSLLIFVVTIAVVIAMPELVDRIETMSKPMEWTIGLAGLFVYYVGFETLFARTPGKWICGTRVVDRDGGPPNFKQAVGRTLARLVPFEPFSLLLSNDGNVSGWHDRWAGTRVVRVR